MFKVFKFPTKTSGAIFCLKEENKFKMTALLKPFEISISCDTKDTLYDSYCGNCEHYANYETIDNDYRKVTGVDLRKVHLPYYERAEIRKTFAKECEFCEGGTNIILSGNCYKKYNLDDVTTTDITIKVPKLAIVYSSHKVSRSRWNLLAEDKESKYSNYRLANVYGDGRICWGDVDSIPKTHLELFNNFFTSKFNRDLTGGTGNNTLEILQQYDHNEYVQNHNIDTQTLEEVSKWTYCDLVVTSKTPNGAVIAKQGNLYDIVPKQYQYKYKSDKTMVVGWIKKTANGFLINAKDLVLYTKTLGPKSKYEILGVKDEVF